MDDNESSFGSESEEPKIRVELPLHTADFFDPTALREVGAILRRFAFSSNALDEKSGPLRLKDS